MKNNDYMIETPIKFMMDLDGKRSREINFLRADLMRTRSSIIREAIDDLVKKYQDRFNQGKRTPRHEEMSHENCT